MLWRRPLLEYTADSAPGARRLSHVILSTDDQEIAKVRERCGLHVPFIRPSELARDDTPALPVVDVVMSDNNLFGKRTVGHPIEPPRSVNIDNAEDWRRAEHLLANISL